MERKRENHSFQKIQMYIYVQLYVECNDYTHYMTLYATRPISPHYAQMLYIRFNRTEIHLIAHVGYARQVRYPIQ